VRKTLVFPAFASRLWFARAAIIVNGNPPSSRAFVEDYNARNQELGRVSSERVDFSNGRAAGNVAA
jgi:hypothetical protein